MPPMPGNEKANPNIAMNEANGFEQWQGMAIDYTPYLSKDVYGHPIAEPDLSNPTRSRHERPLDTIRAFEAAAYGKEYTVGGDAASEMGLQRGNSRQSLAQYDNRRPFNRNSSTSGNGNMPRHYSYGNMQDQFEDDGASEIQGGPSRETPLTPRAYNEHQQPSASSWETRNQGYAPPQKLTYQTPPTPPQDNKSSEKKKSWGKRLSFGKNKA
ncbi:Putative uncharacterized protein [Taphrina deformans PYCC 5710]|uniref:Uncharacterized protein n=1 Tax=Taphrina deformans (strain PYCC 5710 / ATCC 11124 / CBS 356.35 / IMI 108563 / JCM 9778 / NBRC 8474) TaxID=1097556 RepID=R4XC29_TAPDE|nr:Putative uncharacterized protein [Taphrina deformans PYCC 5710]|eukprot:CCG81936.1 Putative uncharacterized protein [Taphrina deformans PYCC 5710]